jgi:hypothetical protein
LANLENPVLTDSEKVVQSKLIQIASKKTGASDAQKLQAALEIIGSLIK